MIEAPLGALFCVSAWVVGPADGRSGRGVGLAPSGRYGLHSRCGDGAGLGPAPVGAVAGATDNPACTAQATRGGWKATTLAASERAAGWGKRAGGRGSLGAHTSRSSRVSETVRVARAFSNRRCSSR